MVKYKKYSKVQQISEESHTLSEFTQSYFDYLNNLFTKTDFNSIYKFVDILLEARENNSSIFFVGNGGSAATASHFAQDLALGTVNYRQKPFKTISLTDNVSYITALGNDEGYANIFVGQLRNLFNSGDILVAISASGNSKNVVNSVKYVNSHGGVSLGLLGFDGGILRSLCNYYILVETPKGDYGPVESMHIILEHIITNYLKFQLLEN